MTYKNVFIIFSFLWNFITGLTSILGNFKIESDFMVELFNGLTSKELAEYTLLVFAIISLCFATGFALILLNLSSG
ncbi:hypothetical protein AU255_18305 [Methyloprofundus sedimenti]|uniref:Uncharacterized protein n=1 Tax=Methyloprofundus sedimenti TaxID=1420851 RepID=A0A1V8M1L7_9GAMM|nr:hypothetical protein [Methyloprofundus sedimenti]OQK15422.1 hypothetical protein AU255_18305 [Methyloprofundus sedimenti]